MLKKKLAALLALLQLAACATQPEQVVGTYVSPTTYSSYNCKQIVSERNRVVQKVNELNGVPATGSKFLLDQILRKEWGLYWRSFWQG